MTIQEIADRIYAYHPSIGDRETCDCFKCGFPEDECTGVVTTCCCSVEVIREAIKLGANLIVVHEPVFYRHMDPVDWLQNDPVYTEKRALLDSHRIAVLRDHDHIHSHKPDGIRYGVMKELGWEQYMLFDPQLVGTKSDIHVKLPKTTVRELALEIKEKMGLNGVRVIGNLDAEVEYVAFAGHITGDRETKATEMLMRDDVDVIIPAEVVDWTALNYARDAAMLGKNKAVLNVGHINSEELGMKYAAKWIAELLENKVPVTFVKSADLYNFV